MSKYLTIILSLLFILSCSNGADTVTEEDAKQFLAEVEEKAKTEGPVYSSAYWIQSNFITYDSQKVAADFSKRGTLEALEQARTASSFDDLELDPAYFQHKKAYRGKTNDHPGNEMLPAMEKR